MNFQKLLIRSIRWGKGHIFFIFILLFILLRLPIIQVPLERDEGIYAYIGWVWLNGIGLPYRDIFEMKPPLLHFIYGIPTLLFGNSFKGIRIFSIIWGLSAFSVFWLFLKNVTEKKGLILAGLVYIVCANDYYSQASGFNAEAIQLLPIAAFFYFALEIIRNKKGWFWFGLVAACAILIKQTAFIPLVFTGLYVLLVRRSFTGLLKTITGAALITGGFVLYFILHGAYGALVTHLGEYARLSTNDSFSMVNCSGGFFKLQCLWPWITSFKVFSVGVLLSFAVIGYILQIRARRTEWWLGLLYTIGIFIIVKMAGWKDWPHYYLLFGPGIMLGILQLLYINKQLRKWLLSLVVVVCFMFLIVNFKIGLTGPEKILNTEYGEHDGRTFLEAPELSAWLQGQIRPGEKLLVFNDEAEIYYYTRIINQTHFGYYYLFVLKPSGKEVQDWFQQQNSSMPDYVVTIESGAMWNVNALWHAFMQRYPYHVVKQYGLFTVYKRGWS